MMRNIIIALFLFIGVASLVALYAGATVIAAIQDVAAQFEDYD